MLKKIKLNLYSKKYKVIENFFSKKETLYLRKSFYRVMHSMHKDYFSKLSFENFFKNKIERQNVLMRAMAFRFLDEKKMLMLKRKIDNDALINPLFYVLISNKSFYKSEADRRSLLDTQYHYDFPYKLYATTYWFSLDDIDEKTGCLCFPNSNKLIKKFLPDKNFRNKYNIDKYFKNSKKLDGLIRKHSDFVKVKSGSAISWSSDVLHGATKSLNENKTRISFNFRLISKKHLYLSKPETIRFIEEFNKNIDEFNFLNLLNIGDYKFCMRAIKKNSKLKKFQSYFNSLNFKNSNSFQKSNSFLRYQDEYQFIKTN